MTALDFPNVLQASYIQAEEMGLSDRIDTLPGNYHSVEIPEAQFDRIILANVLHLEPPEQAIALIRRVTAALIVGGELVIVDMIGDGSLAGERARALYGLHLALRTEHGYAHPLSDLQEWVRQAGLMPEDIIDLGTPRGMGVLVAHKAFL